MPLGINFVLIPKKNEGLHIFGYKKAYISGTAVQIGTQLHKKGETDRDDSQ